MRRTSLQYFFARATKEVKTFDTTDLVKKVSVERDGILFSKSRIMDGPRLLLTGDLVDSNILKEQNLNLWTPVALWDIGHSESANSDKGGTLLKFMILVMVRDVDDLGFNKLILMCRFRF